MTAQPTLSTQENNSNTNASGTICPVCSREAWDELVSISTFDEELRALIAANAPATDQLSAVCGRCARLFESAKDQIEKDAAVQKDGSHVLSTPLRLDADPRFSGRGVTIAFLDSGFYPHVDLTTPNNRILAYKNMLESDGQLETLFKPDVASWHGMMTSVVAAGNGALSNGFYRGLAPEADVVLVKLARTGRITDENIREGLEWILDHREEFDIR